MNDLRFRGRWPEGNCVPGMATSVSFAVLPVVIVVTSGVTEIRMVLIKL